MSQLAIIIVMIVIIIIFRFNTGYFICCFYQGLHTTTSSSCKYWWCFGSNWSRCLQFSIRACKSCSICHFLFHVASSVVIVTPAFHYYLVCCCLCEQSTLKETSFTWCCGWNCTGKFYWIAAGCVICQRRYCKMAYE